MRVEIRDHKVISWNTLYRQSHWTKRKALADRIHMEVRAAVAPQEAFDRLVDIRIRAYQRRTIDSDNICAKLYIDGLRHAGILKDDTPRYVRRVTTESVKDTEDWVEILVE